MDQSKDTLGLLDLMVRPGFCVQNNRIVKINQAAQGYSLAPDTDIRELLLTGKTEYLEFQGGCLYLTLSLSGHSCGACVNRIGEMDVFLLDQDGDQAELRALALAARELRDPLANIMASADRLFPLTGSADSNAQEQAARLNRGLFQILRVVGNMSDASRYAAGAGTQMETLNLTVFLAELFDKNRDLIGHTGISLHFTNYDQPLYCLIDSERLERAILNILSNALKFTSPGGTIEASLTRTGSLLRLTVQDSGEGIAPSILPNVYSRYLRQSSIEDGRYGIGLGMVLIRSVAAQHGGTVLLDQPEGRGARLTMTLALRQNQDSMVRSRIFRVDYAGERDHSLIELSGCLPITDYEIQKVN